MPRQLRFTGVSNEFRNQMLVASLKGRLGENLSSDQLTKDDLVGAPECVPQESMRADL